MALVSLSGISLEFGTGLLLDNVDLNIEPGDRACLVGRNGAGKSSLLKILHGDLDPDGGAVVSARGTRFAYLPQNVPTDVCGTVADVAASWLDTSTHDPVTRDPDHAVGRILSHLSLCGQASFAELSGGQKRRALLARALACEPDLLLLDEPTNHLDIESICWLEEYLLRHCKTFLFVTHDRAFLRRLANRIIDLDRGRLAHWSCDYDTFLRRKAERLHDERVRQAGFDRKLSKEERWIRQGIKARRTRDEGRVRQLMQMREERRRRREVEGSAKLKLQTAARSGQKVIECKELCFEYQPGQPVIRSFTTRIMRGDKIGIVGPNGSGKTTLLKLFTGELAPTAGNVQLGTRLEAAYFDQHRAVLDDEQSVAHNAAGGMDSVTINGRERHVISYLQDFLFTPERAKTPVKVLSGGERNRLLLAMLFARPANLLVMDEPTNDLDAETLELLEEQLLAFGGTALIVSHDRAFLDNCVTSILALQTDGTVREYVGGYTDYARFRAEETPPEARKNVARRTGRPKRFGYNQNRELNALPRKIEKLEAEQSDLHERMADPDYYKSEPGTISADVAREAEILAEIEAIYGRWEELEALRDEERGA